MKNSISIVCSKSIKVLDDNSLEIETNLNKIGYCCFEEISDFPIRDLHRFFSIYPSYKFKIIGKSLKDDTLKLSYKQCHPKLCQNKKKIISTANHYKTLRKCVLKDIDDFMLQTKVQS